MNRIGLLVSAPLRVLLAIRHALTAASVTLLIFAIVSLNIIWGYPWTGMFAACGGMLVGGYLVHWATRPRLSIRARLPPHAPAGTVVTGSIEMTQLGRLPAMDLTFAAAPKSTQWWRSRHRQADPNAPRLTVESMPILMPNQTASGPISLTFADRGIHSPGELLVTTSFPFHLYRSSRRLPIAGRCVITPRPLSRDDSADASRVLDRIGNWTRRHGASDELQYVGSREYVVGMPVRRWDYASWARLGRPIVREYETPVKPRALLLIDVGIPDDLPADVRLRRRIPDVERVLSAATAALQSWSERFDVEIKLTCEPPPNDTPRRSAGAETAQTLDSEAIRLAQAEAVSADIADAFLTAQSRQPVRDPVVVLTARHRIPAAITRLNGWTVIGVREGWGDLSDRYLNPPAPAGSGS